MGENIEEITGFLFLLAGLNVATEEDEYDEYECEEEYDENDSWLFWCFYFFNKENDKIRTKNRFCVDFWAYLFR